jgi:thymidylate synthase
MSCVSWWLAMLSPNLLRLRSCETSMYLFQGDTADDVWLQAASHLRGHEGVHHQESRAGGTQEILGAAFEINDPRQRWITSREPAINPAFALAEVIWIMAGRQDSHFINFWNPKLPEFAGHTKNYHGAYGHRLQYAHKLNQLDRAYKALKENPDSRQVVLQIWHPGMDFPSVTGQPAALDVPCNITSLLKIRRGRLEWTQILRSNDLILGVPHNFVQFTTLQEILAAWLNVEVGAYRHYSDCLHVYTRDLKAISEPEIIKPEKNNARLKFSKEDSDLLFSQLTKSALGMTASRFTPRDLKRIVYNAGLVPELVDWLLILAADCARRKGWLELVAEFLTVCNNPALTQLWGRWFKRTKTFKGVSRREANQPLQQWLPLRI